MSKKEKLLEYKLQKTQNNFMFGLSLTLALFAIRNEFEGIYFLGICLLIALSLFLAGSSYLEMILKENNYLSHLGDKRKKQNKSKIKSITLLILALIVFITMVYVSIRILFVIILS